MFDLLIVEDHHTDRDILLHLMKGLRTMALDVSKLTAAVTDNATALSALSGKVDQLIALHTDPAAQSAVDATATALTSITSVVNSVSAKVDAVLPPPVAAAVEPPPVVA